jgi:hypothetical protein
MHAPAIIRIVICIMFLGASLVFAQPTMSQTPPGDDSLPVLYGAKLVGARIAVDVVSFGCANASYFYVRLDPESAGSFRLSVISRERDRCRMASHIITVTLDIPAIPELGEAKFVLANTLAVPNNLPRSAP